MQTHLSITIFRYIFAKQMFIFNNAQSGITIPAEFCGRPIVYVNWPDMHLSAAIIH